MQPRNIVCSLDAKSMYTIVKTFFLYRLALTWECYESVGPTIIADGARTRSSNNDKWLEFRQWLFFGRPSVSKSIIVSQNINHIVWVFPIPVLLGVKFP